MPRKQWRCFHCDAVFTRHVDAAEHFGADEMALPACQIKGHEHLLVRTIREQEAVIRRFVEERDPVLCALEGMRAEHAQALRRAEEEGYNRGVQDMKARGLRVA